MNEQMFTKEEMLKAIDMTRGITDGTDTFSAEGISGCTEVCTYGWRDEYSDEEIIEIIIQNKS